ncbi:MAG TPA: FHA domain-containing serine/threonine-protein kinase [Pseudomonadota bacterium]|nr:FHA domain-containing serine/threonine-protein kinase [Pseudomonadota bacterium]
MAKLGPGAQVGDQFHLIRKIGEGGCGEVFLAEQTTLGRHTVVKLMHPELSRDASYVERFRREARLAARLIHHHTAAIYAFGETPDKVLWIAMEYIEGESLHNILARESARQIADLLNPVADVLDRAASMGIIHRDVKPDNIMVAPDGEGRRAVLLDFGLARPMEDNDKLTAVGVAVGSPTYMSPEQVFGPTVDAATDRYALGVILYIAVAKRPPFKHEDRVQLVLMHKRNPVPALNSFVSGIPAGHPLDQFFQKAMAKQPGDRFPSARAYIEEFVKAMDAQPLPIFGETRRPSSSGLHKFEQRPASPAPAAQPNPAPPQQPPPPPRRGAAPPPPVPTAARPTQQPPAAVQLAKAAPIQPVAPALRSTLPAMSPSDAVRPEPQAKVEPAKVRSVEAWGAKKAAPPPTSTAHTPLVAPQNPQTEAISSAQGLKRLLAFVGNTGEALDVLSAQLVLLGKHRDCDVVCRAFPSPDNDSITHGVSRQHARLLVVNGKLLVEDLRSLNGTFVDDRRLALGTQVALSDGQLVRLGPVLTLEVRLLKGGAALLRRVDDYHGNFPSTVVVWKEFALGDSVLGFLPAGADSAVRWGTIRVHGDAQDLWWYGPQAVLWQRAGRSLSGAQAVLPGDRITLGSTTIEWDEGHKPGLT